MARRKYKKTPKKPASPNVNLDFPNTSQAPITTRTELIRLIRGGEDSFLELKLRLSNPDKIAQEIVALANTAGGTIIFGVSDQLRVEGVRNSKGVQEELVKICREEIVPPLMPFIDLVSFDRGAILVALDIDPRQAPYRTRDGRFFVRIGDEKREATPEEFVDLMDQTRPLGYENFPLIGLDDVDFDDTLLWSFAKGFEIGKAKMAQNFDTKSFLSKDLLLAIGSGDNFKATVAALVLFGKKEVVKRELPQASVKVRRYSGEDQNSDVIEESIFEGNLTELFDSCFAFIGRYTSLWKGRTKAIKLKQKSHPGALANYHVYSIREAIANLLIHRDLLIREHETQILIFDNSIEFINPRRTKGFGPPASKAIRYGITQRLNPQIVSIFQRKEYGVNLPQGGLPMILKQAEIFSGARVEIYTTGDQFRLKIRGV